MGRNKFHGNPVRFDVMAEAVHNPFGTCVQYIAGVAGGQGIPGAKSL